MVDTGALYIGTTFKGATMGAPRPTQRPTVPTYTSVRTIRTWNEYPIFLLGIL